MKRYQSIFAAAALLLAGGAFPGVAAVPASKPVPAAEKKTEPKLGVPELRELTAKLLETLSPSLVDVDYFFRPDENGLRSRFQVRYDCPNCGQYHSASIDRLIDDRKPFRVPGYAVAKDEFISADIGGMPSWIDTVELVFQGKRYPAKIVAFYPDRESVLLKTASPVPGVVPLTFHPEAKGKKFGFFRCEDDGIAQAEVEPWSSPEVYRNLGAGKDYVSLMSNVLVVNKEGTVIGLSMAGELEAGKALLPPPSDWKRISTEEYEKRVAGFSGMLEKNLYPVKILLRAKKPRPGSRYPDGQLRNEADGVAVKMKDGRVLVAVLLTPSETGRLSRIVLTVDGKPVPAGFVGSLPLFGALVAKPEQALSGDGIAFYTGAIPRLSNAFGYEAEVKGFGSRLELLALPVRLDAFEVGFQGMVVPDSSGFVFTESGELVSLPLQRRRGAGHRGDREPVTAGMVLELARNFDSTNVPQSGGEEKSAWLGIEFQKLDSALARAKGVAEFTGDGRYGLLVTHVYAGSPAAKHGIKSGDILLSLTSSQNPLPVKFSGYNFRMEIPEEFPWANYDQIPPQYYHRIPAPWGTGHNGLTRLLDSIGIGGKATLTILADGKKRDLAFTVSAVPVNFETTPKFNDAKLGMTVCDLTYEVRNYFQLKPEEKGVLVSAVKAGGRAAVAGIHPYEILTSINGIPVSDLESFKKAIAGGDEFRIGVRRFAVTRIVMMSKE